MEILLRLPRKSVFRFKSVCKHTLSLPFSPDLRSIRTVNNLEKLKLQPSLLLKASHNDFFYFDPFADIEKPLIPYSFSVPNPSVVGSCNGLMLLQSRSTDRTFHVYNPTTKQAREISVVDNHTDNEPSFFELSLAFDPSESPHYKVVCIKSTTEADAEADPYDDHVLPD